MGIYGVFKGLIICYKIKSIILCVDYNVILFVRPIEILPAKII